jgi:hypothetical protein
MLDPEATVDVPDGLMDPPVPAEAVMVKLDVPAWLRVNVWPAILDAKVRDELDVLAATEYVTVPLPVPLEPESIVTHDVPPAVQLQPVCVVTSTVPVPPEAAKDCSVGEIE